MRQAEQESQWRPRPLAATSLRIALVVGPLGASVVAALALARLVDRPTDLLGRVGWTAGLFLAVAATLVVTQRLSRRLVPLAVLLPMSLVLSDQVPSRFRVALRASNLRKLREWARECSTEDRTGEPLGVVLSLAAALNAHDRRTRGHSDRVRGFAELIGEELGLSDEDQARLRWAALLHDIGKLRVPAAILNAPGRPNPSQWATLQDHPSAGLELAAPLAPWMGEWIHGIDQHHERVDGTGYPSGLAGAEITLAGRIVSVADAFETMTAVRSYKRPMSVRAARAELAACAGTHFDPQVVRAFLVVSIGRMRWRTGALAALVEVPVLGEVAQLLGQTVALSAVATGGFAAMVGAAAFVAASPGLAPHPTAIPPSAAVPTASTATVSPAPSAERPVDPSVAPAASGAPAPPQPPAGVIEPVAPPPVPTVNVPVPTPTLPTVPPVTVPPEVQDLGGHTLPGT
jgi:HD-GYP domain-containing protein (c-di-GMP phosphodiesterase class II)